MPLGTSGLGVFITGRLQLLVSIEEILSIKFALGLSLKKNPKQVRSSSKVCAFSAPTDRSPDRLAGSFAGSSAGGQRLNRLLKNIATMLVILKLVKARTSR